MTQEEKAKAYDEALENARQEYNTTENVERKQWLEELFPELAESEDEKIRKAIITFFESEDDNTTYTLVPKKDILAWLENQGQVKESPILQQENKTCCKNGNSLTCKNDTILDLLQKMPSYITVDGIFYHFMLRKTTISYMAFYEGEGEGSGKVIFWMTAFSPIDLLNEMLEKLKEKGLL